VNTPGNLLATGRDCDIFEFEKGSILRRSRNGRSQAIEAKTMEFVRNEGYPAPEVFEVSDDGLDLVMARIEGPTMLEAASSQPWKLRSIGIELAGLHQSLHRLPVPEWLPAAPVGTGGQLLHMDLHPLNVILSKRGPIVIDWTNASRGDPFIDVTATWVLLACGIVEGNWIEASITKFGRGVLVNAFLKGFPRPELTATLREVVEWKSQDKNISPAEVGRMHRLLEKHRTSNL
jgi:tRNA A-37 threonylcarbamoyl transferase component Bud32